MTIQELIEELQKIKDKSKDVRIYDFIEDNVLINSIEEYHTFIVLKEN